MKISRFMKNLFKRDEESERRPSYPDEGNCQLDALRIEHGEAVEVQIDFTYSSVDKTRKWVDIVSLKRNDAEAAFVFRVNQRNGFFSCISAMELRFRANYASIPNLSWVVNRL